MANFFLRDIDPDIFREARALCIGRGLRLVDVINDLLREWVRKDAPKPKALPKEK